MNIVLMLEKRLERANEEVVTGGGAVEPASPRPSMAAWKGATEERGGAGEESVVEGGEHAKELVVHRNGVFTRAREDLLDGMEDKFEAVLLELFDDRRKGSVPLRLGKGRSRFVKVLDDLRRKLERLDRIEEEEVELQGEGVTSEGGGLGVSKLPVLGLNGLVTLADEGVPSMLLASLHLGSSLSHLASGLDVIDELRNVRLDDHPFCRRRGSARRV